MSIKSDLESLPPKVQATMMYAFSHGISHSETLPDGRQIAVHIGDSDHRFTIIESAGKWSIVTKKVKA